MNTVMDAKKKRKQKNSAGLRHHHNLLWYGFGLVCHVTVGTPFRFTMLFQDSKTRAT